MKKTDEFDPEKKGKQYTFDMDPSEQKDFKAFLSKFYVNRGVDINSYTARENKFYQKIV